MKNLKKIIFAFAVFGGAIFFANVESARAQSMEWRGTVDDVIQIRIRNRRAETNHISGRAYYDADYNFDGRTPRNNSYARVDKSDGRGKVFIVQQPSRRNNFTTIVQIQDTKGGPDQYRFTVTWD